MAAASAVAILGGCGLGPGNGTSDVGLVVTRGFGASRIGSITQRRVPGSETVMRMLERSFRTSTRYGGGFVESISGRSGSSSRLDWFYYVNGVQAAKGAASTAVHQGDRIWWDLHDWSATDSIPAVVGSFPEPFVHGLGGKRLPVALECAADVSSACARVAAELSAAGVPVARQLLATGSGTNTLGVVVGTWSDLRAQRIASVLGHGPSASGIYARFAGASLQLLNPHGAVARKLGAGAGLVAATADRDAAPIWLITGTDARGVSAAAAALTPGRLRDRFALAVTGRSDIAVPANGG
jgi:hypothetical protein